MARKDTKIKLRRSSTDETLEGGGSGGESLLVDGDGNEIRDGGDGTDDDALIGQILGGRYLIQSLIGKGGMGAVYRAQNTVLNNDVAIKVLLPDRAVNAKVVLRLQKEARALIRLEHPSLVRVFDFDIDEERQLPYLVMKLEEGQSLASVLKLGPMSVARSVYLITQAAEALHHAHCHGIIHRDLKPSNMLIGKGDNGFEQIKILDFGIAKIDDPKAGTMGLTQTGEFFGTPQYMSPEQCKGHVIDARTDVYSLACVLHEMVTGRPPASADNTIEILMQHVNGLRLDYSVSNVPMWLQVCLRHALAKDRDDRYASMGDFAESLRNRQDKKGSTTGSGNNKSLGSDAGGPAGVSTFVSDPVVQVGVPKPAPGEEGMVADEVARGIGIGCLLVGLGYALVHLLYTGHP
jgi:eukaryotic-like serine/threonine-protein kinase